jgi:L-alanine-DL-glutamate epimerase-like enolase superfamily enzyme
MSSRIARVDTFVVRYAVAGAFKFFTATGGAAPTRDTVLVRITDAAGRAGWGQSVPSRTWSYETTESVRSTIDLYLGPALLGLDVLDVDGAWRAMNTAIAGSFSTGQPIAKAGIDLALFDLAGRIRDQDAAARLGRLAGGPVTLSWTLDPRAIADVGPEITAARARGFRNFNVKVGRDAAFDLEVCREIRRHAPEAFVWVDANGGYDLETALAVAPQLAGLGIAAFEQPLPANRLTGYRRLRELGALPILMDEGIVSLADLSEFHQLGLLDGVAMKVSRCGGLTESRRIVEYLQEHGLQFFASGLTDPDVALAACLHLFSAYGLPHPAALNAPQLLRGSVLRTPLRIEGDQAYPPAGPGLGVDVEVNAGGAVIEPR